MTAPLAVHPLVAQPISGAFVRPGDRVRLTSRDPDWPRELRVGVLEGMVRDSLRVVFASGVRRTVPAHQLARLEVSDGRGPFVAHGMGAGFVGGAVVGTLIGVANATPDNEYLPSWVEIAATSVIGGLGGAALGGLVGAVGRREHWSRVRLDPPLRRVSVVPIAQPVRDGSVRLGMRAHVRF